MTDTYNDIKRIENIVNKLAPRKSRTFLTKEGILDREGNLTEYGEHILGRMASKKTTEKEGLQR